jgi:hypothetical protein
MLMIRNCAWFLLAAILAATGATILCAQSVPPPPKPVPDGPSLAETLDSLKQTLLSSGRLAAPWSESERGSSITNVAVNPAACSMRANSSPYFFEEIDTAEVGTMQELWKRALPGADSSKLPNGYAVVINGNAGIYLTFADRETAAHVGELLRQASQICHARPLQLNTAAGSPSLSETLSFIDQKLNEETSVAFVSRGSASSFQQTDRIIDAHGDSSICQLRYRLIEFVDGEPNQDNKMVVSFRRVQKIEVLTQQDDANRRMDQLGFDRWVLAPTTYKLNVIYSGGQPWAWATFADEAMADRVAKAMNHAAELCRPANKEPF